jgi:hypothetical protein
MQVQLQSFYGIPGAVLVESIVQYLTDQWEIPKKMAPLLAIVISFGWNLLLGYFLLHTDWQSSFVSGLVTAMVASGYHEVIK